jgi:endo-1,4-beta-xylanase
MKAKGMVLALVCSLALSAVLAFEQQDAHPTLRSLAESRPRPLGIGAAVDAVGLNVPAYTEALVTHFNVLAPENALKFGPLSPRPGEYDFTAADVLLAFAQQHQMRLRGHTLVWSNQQPAWLLEGQWRRDELIAILYHHIQTVAGRYRGQIWAWDVVNECVGDDGQLYQNFWYQGIGPDYIELAFRWSHEADPNALLFLNEQGAEGLGIKSDGVYNLVIDLLSKGVPIHGVGLQMHTRLEGAPPPADVAANMRRLSGLGLQVQITEMDVRLQEPASAGDLERQDQIYGDILEVCLAAPNCTAFILWGVSDSYTWIPYKYQGWGSALILDRNFQPKPAYQAMLEALQGR